MRFLHTSDWHLGAGEGTKSLLKDQEYFIDDICRIITENAVDAVLLAGDVYDTSVSTREAIRLYDRTMSRLCLDMHVPVLMIAGNHDSSERLSTCRDLLSGAGLYVAGEVERMPNIVEIGDSDIYLLPWITEEKVKSVFPESKESIKSLEDAYRVVLDMLRESFRPGKRHILVAHAYIENCPTSESDHAAVIGTASQVSAKLFDGFDYVALGHLHAPNDVTKTIRYSGTPMAYSFGDEEKQTKSVTIIDTADMSRTVVPVRQLHCRTTITGTLEEVLHPNVTEEVRTGYVKLIVTDSYIGTEAAARLRDIYPELCDWHGTEYTSTGGKTVMTMEEFEALADDPIEILRRFCSEKIGIELTEHQTELFTKAVEEVENSETVIS